MKSQTKPERILVTGGSGFLGSHVADELVKQGQEVVVLDLEPPASGDRRFILADIRDAQAVNEAMMGCHAVFHCAAIADLDKAREFPRLALEVNVLGTLTALEAAGAAGVQRFMFASSVYVFSKGGSVYRTTKQTAERLVEDLSPQLGLRSTILRFGSLYGPRADPQNAILRLVTQAVNERKIDFWGDGTEIREYVHITDAASLAVTALDPKYAEKSLHITGRERISTLELLQMIDEILGGDIEIKLCNEPFEGRYRLTPYSFTSNHGRRLVGDTYVDLGLGLVEAIKASSDHNPIENFSS
ncbi:MAG: NAD(P)-dependent oxidoreductase [Candidatus Nanopelagicales bacterium]|nr:NAD(P)-dependent oxidoreductase [Candidatus Nanopelagicales bacterium]